MNKNHRKGFSVIELMVVATTIGIIAMLGLPQIRKSTQRAEAIVTAQDIGKFVQAVELYGSSEGNYPLAMTYTTMPEQVRDFMPAKWQNGHYSWTYFHNDMYAIVLAYDLDLTAEQCLSIDKTIDNGNITDGNLRVWEDGMFYIFFYDSNIT